MLRITTLSHATEIHVTPTESLHVNESLVPRPRARSVYEAASTHDSMDQLTITNLYYYNELASIVSILLAMISV